MSAKNQLLFGVLAALGVIILAPVNAQKIKKSRDAVKFVISEKKISKKNMSFAIHATIEKGWQLYAHNAGVKGPQPTVFEAQEKTFQIKKVTESKPKEKYEEAFQGKTRVFDNKAKFQIDSEILKNQKKHKIKITFMVCKNDLCLPPDSIEQSF